MQIIRAENIEIIKPLVSVDIITYNHEKFINESLDSVLMQITNFVFEIVICDDYSNDNTRNILLEYYKKYPEKIILRFNNQNVGLSNNYFDNKKACRGKYIAILEGDDYWTDPYKLQKQVDFMETHPEFSMCFANALEVFDFNNWEHESKVFSKVENREYNGSEILSEWIIATATVLYRNNINYNFKYLDRFIYYDTPLFLKLCEAGKIWGMKDLMVVYRRHVNAITCSGLEKEDKNKILLHLTAIDKSFNRKYHSIIKKEKAKEYISRAKQLYKLKSIRTIKDCFMSFCYDPSVLSAFIKLKFNGSR
jgi:glycosyltransferase involved in cell wall biosynthesis